MNSAALKNNKKYNSAGLRYTSLNWIRSNGKIMNISKTVFNSSLYKETEIRKENTLHKEKAFFS